MKKALLIPLIVVLLLLVGCGGRGSTAVNDAFNYARGDVFVGSEDYKFKSGVSELQLEIVKGNPPEEVFPDTKFRIIVQLDNEAAYPITQGLVSVVGVDPQFFTVVPLDREFPKQGFFLAGKSALTPAGDRELVSFDVTAGQLFNKDEKKQEDFLIKAAYISTMEFVDTVCINPNIYNLYEESGCTVEDSQSYSGQGAPLSVTKMDQIVTPGTSGNVEFRITLENKGDGKVGTARLAAAEIGGKSISCHFKDEKGIGESVKLTDKKGDEKEALLLCNFPLRNAKSYETTLSLLFEYDYSVREKHSMVLLN